jgi:hypothetical protein
MEEFTSIVYEAYISGAWVDLSADVRQNPTPRISGIGIMGNSITDRTGDAGTCEFSLDNSTGNSGGLLGYYSPGHPNVRSGWTHGLRIRVTFNYDGYSKIFDDFYIDRDGLNVVTGLYGERSVRVHASNWMKYAADHKLNLMQRKTNYSIFNALQDIIDNSDRKPLRIKWWGKDYFDAFGVLQHDTNTFPTVFDVTQADTKALSEFNKLAMSLFGYVYQRGDGTLVIENQTKGRGYNIDDSGSFTFGTYIPNKSTDYTDAILNESGGTDNILNEDGSNILLEHAQRASFTDADIKSINVSYGKNLANRVKFVLYPRTVDGSAVVLSTLEEPIEILAAETLTEIRNQYKDPNNQDVEVNGYEMVAPVATTDYQMFQNEDGTGTDRTADLVVVAEYGNSEVRYTLTNNNAATSYVTKLSARGKGIYIYDTIEKLYEERTISIPAYGPKDLTLDCYYLDSIDSLFLFAQKSTTIWTGLLAGVAKNEMTVDAVIFDVNRSSKSMMAFMFLEPGDIMKLFETMSEVDLSQANYDSGWYINGYDVEIVAGKFVRWTCVMKFTSRT